MEVGEPPVQNISISSGVSFPSLLASIALKSLTVQSPTLCRSQIVKVAAWTDRPPAVKQRLRVGSGAPRIHVEHPGGGLVLNVHLGPVGETAISLEDSGGVDSSRMVQRQASHALQSYGHPTPFHAMPASQSPMMPRPATPNVSVERGGD